MRPKQVGGSGSAKGAAGSSAPRQIPKAVFMGKVLDHCKKVRGMLTAARKALMAILYQGLAPEQVPLEDEDVDALLLESEMAMEKVILSAANPEKLTRQELAAIASKMDNLQNLAMKVDKELLNLIDELEGEEPEDARNVIQYLLEEWRRTNN